MVFHSDFTRRSWSFLTPRCIIEIIKPTNNEHSKVSWCLAVTITLGRIHSRRTDNTADRIPVQEWWRNTLGKDILQPIESNGPKKSSRLKDLSNELGRVTIHYMQHKCFKVDFSIKRSVQSCVSLLKSIPSSTIPSERKQVQCSELEDMVPWVPSALQRS